MSRIYYNFYPTCPNKNCHEPHKKGGFLKVDDATIVCTACGSKFNKFLNLEQVQGIKNYLLRHGAEEKNLKKTRIFWKITPNSLELAYINWVRRRPRGQFLITWPWADVKFLPVLAIEYIQSDLNNKIAIICNTEEEDNELLSAPSANTSFDNFVYIHNNDIIQYEHIKRDLFKYLEKKLIQKTKNVTGLIRNRWIAEEKIIQCYGDSLTKCKNRIKKDLQDESGCAIHKIITRTNGTSKEDILNETGIFEIILDERTEWSGNLSYNKYWELQVLSSINGIHNPSLEIAHTIIKSVDDINEATSTARIFFISENMPVEELFSIIQQINVDMVVFENADNFIKDIIYSDGWRARYLLNFLKITRDKITTLMFSSKPQIRYLHTTLIKSLEGKSAVTVHTWDTQRRLDALFSREWLESSYPNPCFLLREQVFNHGKTPRFEYIQVDNLDDLFNGLDSLLERIQYQDPITKEIVEKYFRDLRKTPLIYVGDYTKSVVFSRKFLNIDCTFDSILSRIKNLNIDLYSQILEINNSFFRNCRNKPSYLFEKLIKLAKEEIDNGPNFEITIVLHPFDVKGFERLIQESELAELSGTGRISVSSWSTELKSRCRKESYSGRRNIILSTESPYLDFNIYKNNIEKIVFIGCKKNLDRTKEFLEKRINERYTRPVVTLQEDTEAPSLLKEIELLANDIEVINDQYQIYSPLINPDNISKKSYYQSNGETDTSVAFPSRERNLKVGEAVLLAIGKDGQGVLFPINATIHYREHCRDPEIKELRIEHNYDLLKNLRDVEIFMGKGSIHRSLKVQFAKIMIETAGEMPIESGLLKWDSFYELFYDSVLWIRYLLEARKYIVERKDDCKNVDDELATRIVESGTSAEDSAYVKCWWEDYEGEMSINSEIFRIPHVEHPRNVNDMKKIYNLINEIMPFAQLTEIMAIRSYNSANVIQKLRRSVLSGKSDNLPNYLIKAFTLFRPIVWEMWERSDKFYAEYFDIITLNKDAIGYRVLNISDL